MRSRSDDPLRRYGHLKFSKMAASRHLGFGPTESRSIRSAVPENPTIGSNTKSIGRSVAEIWPFETLTLMTSLMTSQGPGQKSEKKNYFPQVGDHRVKKSAQLDKNWRRRSILKKCLMTSLMTSQGPDQKSVKKNYFPQVGDHRVKKSDQSDKKWRRRSILKNRADKPSHRRCLRIRDA